MNQSIAITKTLDMMHALDNGATIDRDALANALESSFGINTADYGYHDTDANVDDLRAAGGIVIERGADYDYVNLPIHGVQGILVSRFTDGHLWSLGLDSGDILY